MKKDDARSFNILIVYSLIALIILVLDISGVRVNFLWGARYMVMLSMPLFSLKSTGKLMEQRLLAASLFLIAAGDFFLYAPLALNKENPRLYPWGIALFSCAYLLLSAAYARNAGKDKREIILALIPIMLFAAAFYAVASFAGGILRICGLTLEFTISLMLWNALCVPIRGWYDSTSSKLITASALLMLLCDAGVGLGMMAGISNELLFDIGRNIVWSAYIPAWAIILMLSSWRIKES